MVVTMLLGSASWSCACAQVMGVGAMAQQETGGTAARGPCLKLSGLVLSGPSYWILGMPLKNSPYASDTCGRVDAVQHGRHGRGGEGGLMSGRLRHAGALCGPRNDPATTTSGGCLLNVHSRRCRRQRRCRIAPSRRMPRGPASMRGASTVSCADSARAVSAAPPAPPWRQGHAEAWDSRVRDSAHAWPARTHQDRHDDGERGPHECRSHGDYVMSDCMPPSRRASGGGCPADSTPARDPMRAATGGESWRVVRYIAIQNHRRTHRGSMSFNTRDGARCAPGLVQGCNALPLASMNFQLPSIVTFGPGPSVLPLASVTASGPRLETATNIAFPAEFCCIRKTGCPSLTGVG